MKRLAMCAAVVMLVGCGGQEAQREDRVVAEVLDAAPFCDPGETGTGVVFTSPDRASCEWTCASDANVHRAFFHVDFWKDADGVWQRDAHAEPYRHC